MMAAIRYVACKHYCLCINYYLIIDIKIQLSIFNNRQLDKNNNSMEDYLMQAKLMSESLAKTSKLL
jgi:hypothetical protein